VHCNVFETDCIFNKKRLKFGGIRGKACFVETRRSSQFELKFRDKIMIKKKKGKSLIMHTSSENDVNVFTDLSLNTNSHWFAIYFKL
jgi:hypothetical protein